MIFYVLELLLTFYSTVILFVKILRFIYLFIFGYAGSVLLSMQAFSSCSERGLLLVGVCRLFIAVTFLVAGRQWLQLPGSGVWLMCLWHMGLVAPRHVGSSWIRDRTCVSYIGRQILIHCTTKEVPTIIFLIPRNLFSSISNLFL